MLQFLFFRFCGLMLTVDVKTKEEETNFFSFVAPKKRKQLNIREIKTQIQKHTNNQIIFFWQNNLELNSI